MKEWQIEQAVKIGVSKAMGGSASSVRELEVGIERLKEEVVTLQWMIDDIKRIHGKRLDMHYNRLTALETPNQSDCPLGRECCEDKGYWIWGPQSRFGGVFEECGNTCPKKKDERAETIRRARDLIEVDYDFHNTGYTRFTLTRTDLDLVVKALRLAEQSIKGGGE